MKIKKHILTLSLILATVVGYGQSFNYQLNYGSIKFGNSPTGQHQFNGLANFVNGITIPLRAESDSSANAASTQWVKRLVQGLTYIPSLAEVVNVNNYASKTFGINNGGYISKLEVTEDNNVLFVNGLETDNSGWTIGSDYKRTGVLSNRNLYIKFDGQDGVKSLIKGSVNKGLEYDGNFESNFTSRSLVDKRYVDSVANASSTSGVTSVNGRTGAVTGLAEASSLANYELLANKSTTLTSPSNTTYPTTLAVANSLANYMDLTTTQTAVGSKTFSSVAQFGTTEKISITGVGNASALGFNINASNGAIYNTGGFGYQFTHFSNTTDNLDKLSLSVSRPNNSIVSNSALVIDGQANVSLSSLSGTGDRAVFADSNGILKIGSSSGTIPTLQQVLTAGNTASIEPTIQKTGSNIMLGLPGSGAANGFTVRGTGRDWYHFVQINGNYTFGANQGDKYFFTNDGKFGVNQSSPAQAIDVIGQVKSTAVSTGNAFSATSTSGVGFLSSSTSGISISGTATTGKAGRFETSSGTGVTLDVINSGTGDILTGSNSGGITFRVANNGGANAAVNNGGVNDLVRNTDLSNYALKTSVFSTTGTSATLLSSGRYIPQNASLTIYTLPTTAAVGDVIFINGKGAGGWRISQNTGQVIHGATDTTTGSSGYVGSTARYNSIAIVCVTANTEWIIQSSQGSLTIN